MRELLLISPIEALAVVVATVGMYVAMVILLRLIGQRMLSGMSSFDLAAIIGFGAILGRAALGDAARLGGGIVALVTLVILQLIAGSLRIFPMGARAVMNKPVLIMVDGQIVPDHFRRTHVSTDELRSRLRLAGVHRFDQVALAVLEPTGAVSVLRQGERIDPGMLAEVRGATLVPPALLSER